MQYSLGNKITPYQLLCILTGTVIGVGLLSLPNEVTEIARQNGWISVIVGGIYPLYMVCIACILQNKFPEKNILQLSKKFFGNFIGNFLNIIFMLNFIIYTTTIASGLTILLATFIMSFMSPIKLLIFVIFLGAISSYSGLKPLASINELIFVITIVVCLISLVALGKGKILNVLPVFDLDVKSLLSASFKSYFSYGGTEIIFLLYPLLSDKKNFKSYAVIAVLFIIFLYSSITFLTIYYCGIDLIKKSFWAILISTKSIEIPIINNFRFIFMFLWTIVNFKTISNNYFASVFILHDLLKKFSVKKLSIIMYPILVFMASNFINEESRRTFLKFIIPKYVLFNIVYFTIICCMVLVKRNDLNEKK
ncbi:MAG: spore germination protein [Clostridium sp.]|jgi:spore germination protein (amino acid permease)|uniref:GerAB/ArcD/ProY family transporter n=1 Tax=Clostridium sp. TaxID=1506 RepID=UPI0025C0C072|nr:GerAB/ArcD/ProY family transporter [Clostridium sp.]MCH3964264.1 spore germination protein [Clostridium sp.]MCI1715444.1 spore germination protein [Clostridium sp.]MCI1799765.1 spore germination protein [Clostridium sp.]MCI1813627.1 spore germination protein [Clostridium sp.]MCI1870582.1 spore germination protein [Clostridium sp.]